uniref:Proteasomal ubiquitin receptor ADRM1 homolog n=1 Tax=Nyssomyia neivai TaxID=330878 RepID=A0A1L8E3N7_9DIPT
MSGPIFGNTNSSGLSSTNNSRHLVEFKAGRMNMVGKMVHPDTRKGLVYIYQSEDGLIHFCWKDRTTGNTEDDLIIFPDDCEFKKIEQCNTGRVYLLKFKSSSRKLFFWMQETKTDKDDEFCRRINDVFNNPPSNIPSGGRGDNSDLQYMLNNMSQQQLMQLFGGVGQIGGLSSLFGGNTRTSESSSARNTPSGGTASGASVGAAVTPPPVTSSQPAAPKKASSGKTTNNGTTSDSAGATDKTNVLLSELQSYLSEFSPSGASGGGTQRNRGTKPVELSAILNTESVGNIASDEDCRQELEPLLPKTAAKEPVDQQLRETVASPQFQQALAMFNNALQSGQLGPVFSQFNLGVEAVTAANDGDTESFLQALEKSLTDKGDTKAAPEEK